MNIADLLSPERVQVRADLRSKKRVIEDLAALLASGVPSTAGQEEQPDAFKGTAFTSLINREKLGTTGLGSGVAIPHGRVRGLEQAVGAFMRLNPGIDYEAADGLATDLVFALLVPEQATDEHLNILRLLAEMFMDEDFCSQLRTAEDAAAVYSLLHSYQPVAS